MMSELTKKVLSRLY